MQSFSSFPGRGLIGFYASDYDPDSIWILYVHWVYYIDKNPQKWNLKTLLEYLMVLLNEIRWKFRGPICCLERRPKNLKTAEQCGSNYQIGGSHHRVNTSKSDLGSDILHTPGLLNCSEHQFSQKVTKNRTPLRRSGGPLSTKTGRQIQDSSNGKTGNRSDLWNSKPEQTTFIDKLWFDINWFRFKWWSSWVLLVLDLYICTLTTVYPMRWLALELIHKPNTFTKSCLTFKFQGDLSHFGIWCILFYFLQSSLLVFKWFLAILIGKRREEGHLG